MGMGYQKCISLNWDNVQDSSFRAILEMKEMGWGGVEWETKPLLQSNNTRVKDVGLKSPVFFAFI